MAVVGLGLTGVWAVVFVIVWGGSALIPAMTFGTVATVAQVAAQRAMEGAQSLPFAGFVARWGKGMLFRMAGLVLIPVAVAIDRELFAPLPAAFGFLGVLLPLLFLEWRWSR